MRAHPGFGLYIHWPFCAAKCPYCDFNSHVSAEIDQARWRSAYLAEIERAAGEIGPRVLSTIFFGGGTPSLMDPDLVAALIEAVRKTWPTVNDLEITLEANPTSVEAGRFAGYRDAGVNRVSLGLQALDDADLRRLGRLHSAAEGIAAYDLARSVFERVSFDLIYGRQDQTLEAWTKELEAALSMDPTHLSLYQLTIEDGTAFGDRHARGSLAGLPDEDLAADLFERTNELTVASGLPAYEISNHARSGEESRHNLIYWRGGDYLGIGPGAHGRITMDGERFATETSLSPRVWLERVEHGKSGEDTRTALGPEDVLTETLMMGLRLTEGVQLERLGDRRDCAILYRKINGLIEMEMLELTRDTMRLTEKGRPLLNAVLRQLIAG